MLKALVGLRLLATVLATVGQMGILGASLTLASDERSAAAHAEPLGIDLHHGHNEATCAACTALSFHSAPQSNSAPALVEIVSRSVAAKGASCPAAGAHLLPNSCRAPPREG